MNEKKYIIIGTICLILVLLIVVVFAGKKGNEEKLEYSNDPNVIVKNAEAEAAAVTEGAKKAFDNIDLAKYLELYKGDTPSLVMLARESCYYCNIAEPIVQSIMKKYKIDIYYLDPDKFTEEEKNDFINSNERFSDGFGTPMLFLVGNNSIIDVVEGLTDRAHYIEFFKLNGFIKE